MEKDYQIWFVTHDEDGIENIEVLEKDRFMWLVWQMMHDVFNRVPCVLQMFIPRKRIIKTFLRFFDAHVQLRLDQNLNKSEK